MANAWGISWGDGGGGVAPPVDGGIVGMIASGLTRALAVLSTDKEEDLEYATSAGGSFSALSGFVIHQDLLTEPTYDDDSHGGSQTRRAYCKGPVSPRLSIGYQVRDNTQIPAMIWAVGLGFLFFGDIPSLMTIAGSVIIIGAGLFLGWQERRIGQP